MADAVKIANLQIEISDNSQTVTTSLKEFVKTLSALRDATRGGAGLSAVAKGVTNLNKATSDSNGSVGVLDALAKSLAKAVNPAEQLASALERVAQANRAIKGSGNLQNAVKTATKLQEQVTPTTNGVVDKGRGEVESGGNYMSKTQDSIKQASTAMEEFQERTARARETLATIQMRDDLKQSVAEWVKEFEKAPTAMQRLASAMRPVQDALRSIGQFGSHVFHNILPSGISRLISQFARLAKMKILRTIISNLMKGFSEGLQNAYQWAKLTGDQFALSMDSIATSMNYAKNSIGAAFAQVLDSVAPIIDKLVDWLVTAIDYVNMFFAALSGSDTYVKAKKVAMTYDGEVGNAMGNVASGATGATAAVKELEEELSVLDFDELNQLSDQNDANYGGVGGGGSGGSGKTGKATPDYGSMFERVNIDNNVMKVAEFFKENFETILDIVKAIGLGILAWKLASAFSSAIKELSAMQKLGFATLVIGVTLAYEGGYELGKNGFTVKGLVESIVGIGLAAIGGTMMWGVKGLIIGVTVSVIANVIGYIKGMREANEIKWLNELKDKSYTYRVALEGLDDANKKLSAAEEALAHIKGLSIETDEELNKISIGEELLKQISTFEGKVNLSATEVAQLNGLVEAYNKLGLTDAVKWWQDVNGVVHTNVEEIQKAIDKYKEYATVAAYQNLLIEAVTAQAEYKRERDLVYSAANASKEQYQIAQAQLDAYIAQNYPDNQAILRWKPGDNPLGNAVAFQDPQLFQLMANVNAQYATAGQYNAAYNTYDEAYNVATQKVDYFAEQLGIATGQVVEGMEDVSTSSQNASTNLDSIPKISAGGLGIAASISANKPPSTMPDTLNAPGNTKEIITENVTKFSTIGVSTVNAALRSYVEALEQQRVAGQGSVAMLDAQEHGYGYLTGAMLKGLGAGKDWVDIVTLINNQNAQTPTIVNDSADAILVQTSAMTRAGNAAETSAGQTSAFDAALSMLGVGVDFNNIATGISNNLGAENWRGMANKQVQTPIETQISLTGAGISASTIYNKIGNLIGAQPFANIGTGAKGKMEGQVNLTGQGVSGSSIFTRIGSLIGSQPYANIGTGAKDKMEYSLNKTGQGVSGNSIYSTINGLITSQPYSSIGTDTKDKIENKVNLTGQGVQGSSIFSKIGSLIGGQPYSNIGTGAKGEIEGQVNRTGEDVDGNGIYRQVERNSINNPWQEIGYEIGENIVQGLETSFDWIPLLMNGVYNMIDRAVYDCPWSYIGNYIGSEIRWGLQSVIGSFQFNVEVNFNGQTYTVGGYAVAYFAQGGFPQSGSLFIAGEDGSAEAVGTIGGKTAVANRDQIASAIAQALKPMLGSGGGRTETIEVNTYLDSAIIAKANAKGQVALKKQFNMRNQA